LTGAAVNVTDVPAHIVLPGLADILTAGTNTGFTVIVMPVPVAVAVVTQAALLVSTQVTISPFTSAAFV
jgi:hypothetical protein